MQARNRWSVGLAALGLFLSNSSWAQDTTVIIRDDSLGPHVQAEIVGSDGLYTIGESDGTRPGDGLNLFQSLLDLQLASGDTAVFGADHTTDNIITRVTGGTRSQINGTLATDVPSGAGNLWLLNPQGVFFGSDAELDVQGSFYASTADYLAFEEDGGEVRFYADPDGPGSALSFAHPSAFGFLDANPPDAGLSGIQVDGSYLAVGDEQSLVLVGDGIELDGANGELPFLRAWSGKVGLVSVGSPGEVGISANGLPVVQSDAFESMGDVSIRNEFKILTTESTGGVMAPGAVQIDGRDISIETNSYIATAGRAIETDAISIDASRDFEMAGASLYTYSEDERDAGHVRIQAGQDLSMLNSTIEGWSGDIYGGHGAGVYLSAGRDLRASGTRVNTYSQSAFADAGRVDLLAGRDLDFLSSELFSFSSSGYYEPAAGALSLEAGRDLWIQGAGLDSWTNTDGRGGDVRLHADGDLVLQSSYIDSSSNFSSETIGGDAGNVTAWAGGDIEVWYVDVHSYSASSWGNAGGIRFEAQGDLSLLADSKFNAASLDDFGSGNAGQAEFVAGGDLVLEMSKIDTSTWAPFGAAGDSILHAGGSITLDASVVDTGSHSYGSETSAGGAGPRAGGHAGDIEVVASGTVQLTNGSVLQTTSDGEALVRDRDGNGLNNDLLEYFIADPPSYEVLGRSLGDAGNVTIVGGEGILAGAANAESFAAAINTRAIVPVGANDPETLEELGIDYAFASGNAGSVSILGGDLSTEGQLTLSDADFDLTSWQIDASSQDLTSFYSNSGGSVTIQTGGSLSGSALGIETWTDSVLYYENPTSGSVTIEAGDVNLDGLIVDAATRYWGRAGDISIETTTAGLLLATPSLSAEGTLGDPATIELFSAGELTTTGGSVRVTANSVESEKSGTITFEARGNILLDGTGFAARSIDNFGTGTSTPGADIGLTAGGDIVLQNGVLLTSAILAGGGTAGGVSLDAGGSITLVGATLEAVSTDDASGTGGAIDLKAGGDVNVGAESEISSWVSVGSGSGGDISIESGANLVIDDSTLSPSAADGDAGATELLATGDLEILAGSKLYSFSSGGDAGRIEATSLAGSITASSLEILGGAWAGTGSKIDFSAPAGDITIESSTFGAYSGDRPGGGVSLTAGRSVFITGNEEAGTRTFFNLGDASIEEPVAGAPLRVSAVDSILVSATDIDTSGSGGAGEISLVASGAESDVTITGDSRLSAQARNSLITRSEVPISGGQIEIRAGKEIVINGDSSVRAGGIGSFYRVSAGEIALETTSADSLIHVAEGASITTNLWLPVAARVDDVSQVEAGRVTVKTGRLEIHGENSRLSAEVWSTGDDHENVTAPSVSVVADSLELVGSGEVASVTGISASAFASSPGGEVAITAEHIVLDEFASISASATQLGENSPGNAGRVSLQVDRLELHHGSRIEAISLHPFDIAGPRPESGQTGSAGTISIALGSSAYLDGGSSISVDAIGSSTPGLVQIRQSEEASGPVSLFVEGGYNDGNDNFLPSRISASAMGEGEEGGNIEIDIDRLSVLGGGRIDSTANWGGVGGDVVIDASEWVEIDGSVATTYSQIASQISTESVGTGHSAGSVSISTPELTLSSGGEISSTSSDDSIFGWPGEGNAGAIELLVSDKLLLQDASITVAADLADGGDILINAAGFDGPGQAVIKDADTPKGQLVHLVDSEITATVAGGEGDGGNVVIDPLAIVLDNSFITANAVGGSGGNILLVADAVISNVPLSQALDASSQAGVDGVVNVQSPETNIERSLKPLAVPFLDASSLLLASCDARGGSGGSFQVVSREGGGPAPDELLYVALPGSPVPETSSEIASLYAEAVSQQGTGQWEQSLAPLEQAFTRAQMSGDAGQAATLRGGLAAAALALGAYEGAETQLEAAQVEAKSAEDQSLQAVLRVRQADLAAVRGRWHEALAGYRDAVQLSQRAEEAGLEAQVQASAARAALEVGDVAATEEALSASRAGIFNVKEAAAQNALRLHLGVTASRLAAASAEDSAQRKQSLLAAHALLTEAEAKARASKDDRARSFALGELGILYAQEKQVSEALSLARRAVAAAEAAEASGKAGSSADARMRWHGLEGKLLWQKGQAQEAVEAYSRAVALAEASHQDTRLRYGAGSAWFQEEVARLYRELVDVLLQAEGPQWPKAQRQALLAAARQTMEGLKAAELRDYFRDECVVQLEASARGVEDVDPRAAVVYPVVLEDRLELLVSRSDGIKRYTVPVSREDFNAEVARFGSLLKRRTTRQYLRPAQQLHAWLVEPYEAELAQHGIDTLVFVPGGALRTVPLAALHDGQGFLIERYAVAVTPSLDLLAPESLVPGDEDLLLAGLSEAVQGFAALAGVPGELDAIESMYGGEVLLNQAFTEEEFELKLEEERPGIVHLASHAEFTGDPETSFVLTFDGRLSMDELSQLLRSGRYGEQPVELLMLSACETAAGNERAALGLAGVAVRSGARSAMGSLWPVSDEATADLVVDFYRSMGETGVSKARALQTAQNRLRKQPQFGHPFYWAPFLLINNWL